MRKVTWLLALLAMFVFAGIATASVSTEVAHNYTGQDHLTCNQDNSKPISAVHYLSDSAWIADGAKSGEWIKGACPKDPPTLPPPLPKSILTAAATPSAFLVGDKGAVVISGTETVLNEDKEYVGANHANITVKQFAGGSCSGDSLKTVYTHTASTYYDTKTHKWVFSDGSYTASGFTVDTTKVGTFSFGVSADFDEFQCVIVNVTTVKPPLTLLPEEPNRDPFCYGPGATSYMWITPQEFTYLTTAPQPELGGKPYWSYGTTANATKGTDFSGVMQNGMTPTCLKGTPTGQYVDNQGWWTTSGLDVFAGIVNPQGTKTVPEHAMVVTIP